MSILMSLVCLTPAFAEAGKHVIIDVRTPAEYAESHVAEAINIDVMDKTFDTKINELDKQKTYKVYCRSGKRSAKAESLMKAKGFQNVENLGSLKEAADKLKMPCEGPKGCQ
jgi:rhodanese-related sulfurtransferase